MKKLVGTTETYDPCFVDDWDSRLLDANLIITKELNNRNIDKLIINKDKCILHHTVTGLGNTEFEPKVKPISSEFIAFKKLIESGFPIEHYVLRIDPIIPFNKVSLEGAKQVLIYWKSWKLDNYPSGRIRCRFSLLDLYPHVKGIFERSRIWYDDRVNFSYYPDKYYRFMEKFLSDYKEDFGFETCAEPGFIKSDFIRTIGCASDKDLDILGEDRSDYSKPSCLQRTTCTCLAKKQILGVKPGRCPHGCIYCYWKS